MRARTLPSPRAAALLCFFLVGCARYRGRAPAREVDDRDFAPPPPEPVVTSSSATVASDGPVYQRGYSTWYGPRFAGKMTTNGERFDPKAMTAAHRKLPFNTWVEVRVTDTGRSVRVRINDRGPFGDAKRIIDLSQHAAEVLGTKGRGTAPVELRIVSGP